MQHDTKRCGPGRTPIWRLQRGFDPARCAKLAVAQSRLEKNFNAMATLLSEPGSDEIWWGYERLTGKSKYEYL